jgi:hypothetical protein
MGSKEDAVSWSELGAMIHEDEALMRKLRRALRISHIPLLEGDYLEQLDELAKEAL